MDNNRFLIFFDKDLPKLLIVWYNNLIPDSGSLVPESAERRLKLQCSVKFGSRGGVVIPAAFMINRL